MTDLDRRTLKIVWNAIKGFKENAVGLRELVSVLDGAYYSFESIDKNLEDVFFQKFVDIESIYAGVVNRGGSAVSLEEQIIVNAAVASLEQRLIVSLREYSKIPDLSVEAKVTEFDAHLLMCSLCKNVWECSSTEAMVVCPKCDQALHNSRYHK